MAVAGFIVGAPLTWIAGRQHLWAAVTLNIYVSTLILFGFILYLQERSSLRESWLWRAMAQVVLIHALFLAVISWLTVRAFQLHLIPGILHFAVLCVLCIIETAYISVTIIDRSRPRKGCT